jgi:hypothetical protein
VAVITVRANVKAEQTELLESSAKAMFTAIAEAQPEGVRYAVYRVGEDATYLIMLKMQEGFENPLLEIEEFRTFQENRKQWLTEPPVPEELTVVGEYRSF